MTKKHTIDVAYVANLARIELSGEALARYQRQLTEMVGYIDQISELDVSNIDPMLYGQTLGTATRQDVVSRELSTEAVMANAPDPSDGMFRVPRIVE